MLDHSVVIDVGGRHTKTTLSDHFGVLAQIDDKA